MAATYTLTDFTNLVDSLVVTTPALTGSFPNVGSSTVDVTVNATGGRRWGSAPSYFIAVPHYVNGTTTPGLTTGKTTTSDLTISFSKPVTNVKLSVMAVGYNNSGTDEYLYHFKENGSILGTLPAVAMYGSNDILASVTAAGGSGIVPAVTPAYSSSTNGDGGGGILTFPGTAISSVGFTIQVSIATAGTGFGVAGVEVISFDYTPNTTVSAPIFSTKEKPAVFSEEVK
jgi:hypothetical protein